MPNVGDLSFAGEQGNTSYMVDSNIKRDQVCQLRQHLGKINVPKPYSRISPSLFISPSDETHSLASILITVLTGGKK